MNRKSIIILSALITLTINLKMTVKVDSNQGPVCFYENLRQKQRYLFKIDADSPHYRADVMKQDLSQGGSGWKQVVTRIATREGESISKMSEQEGIYTFCISSSDTQNIVRATLTIETGLEQANFDYLPNLDDKDNLNRQVEWLEGQKDKLFSIINRMENLRSSNEALKSGMSTTMIILAILGLIIIAAANVLFFTFAKKTLKDRKLI